MDPVVILGTETVSVGPGQEHRLPVRIRNQGRRVESYRVDVVGAPAPFAAVVPPVVSVLPGREAEVDVIFRPPGGAATPTGTLPFAVRATSEVEASSSAVAEGRLELAGVAGLQAWAPETTRSRRWSARYHVEFANQGNAAARLALTAHDPTAVTKLELAPDVIDLAAGGRATAELKVKTREPFLRGSPVNRNIQVTCQTFPFGAERPVPGGTPPQDDPNHRTFQLTFQQKPILPKFALPLIALVVAGLLVLAVITLRGDKRPTLDFTGPLSPAGFSAEQGGPTSILLRWDAVPNAEGYEVRRTKAAGQPGEMVLAADLPPEQHTFTVDDELLEDTEYCFTVRALGPEELASALADEKCARTSPATTLQAPTDVAVAAEGEDQYRVTWLYPDDVADIEFEIIADQVVVQQAIASGVAIELLPEVEARTVPVQVRATRGEDKSPASAPPFPVEVPALPVETVAPSTEPAPPTTPVVVVPPPTTAGGGDTTTITTVATPTTTTPSPAAVSELQNLEPAFVAMLRQVQPAAGGKALPAQRDELAAKYGIAATDIGVFSNRDTVVVPGTSTLDFAAVPASQRYFFVTRADQAQAEATCAVDTTNNCTVLRLSGAAVASEGKQIALLETVPSGATTADVDQRLAELREALDRPSIHVLRGADYSQFATGNPIIFATGFDTAGEAAAFCETNALPPAQCDPRELQPAD